MTSQHNRVAYLAAFMMFFMYLFAPFSVHAQSGNVVLWNKLGSDTEIANSESGSGFNIHSDSQGGVLSVPGKFGNALATTGGNTGGGGYLSTNPNQFFPTNKTRGTVVVWIQKKMDKFIPYVDGLIGIFGFQPYDDQGGEKSYSSIAAFWSDGVSTYFSQDWSQNGIEFVIFDSSNKFHATRIQHWEKIPVDEWVHLAFVWDLSGIDGSIDKLRIYKDGILAGRNSDNFSGIWPSNAPVKILGNHAYSRVGHPMAYLDNLIVYDYAKTDFSDRFNESPVGCEEGDLPNLSAVLTRKSGSQNARTWTISLSNQSNCPAENAQIDGLMLTQTAGSACTPVITSPLSFPLGIGNIPAGAQASGTATIAFSGCPNIARFKATIPFSSNNDAVSGSKTLNNQFR